MISSADLRIGKLHNYTEWPRKKQWLGSFTWKTIVWARNFLFVCLRERVRKFRKKIVKIKILIWHMFWHIGEMVKIWGSARFYLSCSFSCQLYILMKILLVKLKVFFSSAHLNLIMPHATAKVKTKIWKEQIRYPNKFNLTYTLTNLILITFSALSE